MKKTIEWLENIGVDAFMGDKPINRLEAKSSSVEPKKEEPKKASSLLETFPQIAPDQTRLQTEKKLQNVHSLEELKQVMQAFEGCPLKKSAQNLVFGEGALHAPVMIIGEGPGADEDRQGRPFVGLSGQLLDKMLAAVGMSRTENVYITNVVPYRPPGNRQPTTAEIALYLPFLERHIDLINPKFLLLLGGTAVKALLNTQEGIIRLRGRWQSYIHAGRQTPIPVLATYHPAYLLRSPSKKREAWHDFLTLKQAVEQGKI